MYINEYVNKYRHDKCFIAPRIVCCDKFSFSAQANRTVCSIPQSDYGPWFAFEVHNPSSVERLLIPYADDDCYTNTTYRYVPVEVVDAILKKHKGIDESKIEIGGPNCFRDFEEFQELVRTGKINNNGEIKVSKFWFRFQLTFDYRYDILSLAKRNFYQGE